MRKHYIDNLKWVIMLQLILMHTCMCFNSSRLPFYYTAPGFLGMDAVMFLSEPWRQGAFFLVSGMSMRFSCERSGAKHYAIGRITKILLPFAVAKLVLLPPQAYLGSIVGNFGFENYWDFMQRWFLPNFWSYYINQNAHLWFMKVLLVVTAAVGLFLFVFNRKDKLWQLCGKADIRVLYLLAVPVTAFGFVFHVGYYDYYGRYFIIFLLGYLMFSHDHIVDIVKEHWRGFTAITALLLLYLTIKLIGSCYYTISDPLDEALWYACGWFGTLACVGIFARFVNFSNRVTEYFSGSSFHIYLVHQTILLYSAYFITQRSDNIALNYLLVTLCTTALSILSYEIWRHIPGARALFGIFPKKKK